MFTRIELNVSSDDFVEAINALNNAIEIMIKFIEYLNDFA